MVRHLVILFLLPFSVAHASAPSYQKLSAQAALTLWQDFKEVTVGEVTQEGAKFKLVDDAHKTHQLLVKCTGDCHAASCGKKIWRAGCEETATCTREEFELQ